MLCEPVEEATGYLGFIPPAMIGPPEKCYYREVTDIPGLIHCKFGKGQGAFLTFRIGSIYHHTRHYGHAALVMTALNRLLGYKQELEVEASPMIEVARQIGLLNNFEWYGFLNHTGQLGNAFHEPVPVQRINMTFKPLKPVKSIRSLALNKPIGFNQGEKGWVDVTLPELHDYEVLLVEY